MSKLAERQKQKIADLEARSTTSDREESLRRDLAAAHARIEELERLISQLKGTPESVGHTSPPREFLFIGDLMSPESLPMGDSLKRPWKP